MTVDELKILREELGLNQRQMAAEIGLKLRAYQNIETGQSQLRKLHQPAVERVALAYGAKGALEEGIVTFLIGSPWFEQLTADARAFTSEYAD